MNKGLTLIEVLISLAIVSVVGILLMATLVNSTNVGLNQSLKVEQGLSINDALSQIRSQIKQASGVSSSFSSDSKTYNSSANTLILTIPSLSSSNEVIQGISDTVVFYTDSNLLKMQIFPDAQSSRKAHDQVLSINFDSIDFEYLDNSNPPEEVSPSNALKVTVTLRLKQRNGMQYQTTIATTEANLRN